MAAQNRRFPIFNRPPVVLRCIPTDCGVHDAASLRLTAGRRAERGEEGRAAADAIAAIVAADVVVVVAAALATSTPNNNTIHYAAAGPLVTHGAADTLTHPSRAKPGAVCSVMAGPAPPLGPGQPGAKSASVNVCVCVCWIGMHLLSHIMALKVKIRSWWVDVGNFKADCSQRPVAGRMKDQLAAL